jgi:hypothetical protein
VVGSSLRVLVLVAEVTGVDNGEGICVLMQAEEEKEEIYRKEGATD